MRRIWMARPLRPLARCMERLDAWGKPAFYCNVCGRDIRHPLDGPAHHSGAFARHQVIGGGFRPREQCPLCLASDRARFVAEALRVYTDALCRPCRVLDIAPMPCTEGFLRGHNARCAYTSGDIVPGRAQLTLDITRMALPDAAFDYVICCHVLEHVPDEGRAVREMTRVTKPGGAVLLSMPVALALESTLEDARYDTPQKRLAAYGQRDHVRLYGRDVAARLQAYGLDVREIVAGRDMPDAARRYGLIPEDRVYLCRRD